MLLPRKVQWWILSAITAAVAGVLTRKLVNALWLALSGRELPPEDDDRSISVPEAAGQPADSWP